MSWQKVAKARMRVLKITQNDLISIMGVTTRGAVGHYLSGRRTPSIDQFKALAERLGMKLDELMSGEYLLRDESAQYSIAGKATQLTSGSKPVCSVPLVGSIPDINFRNLSINDNTPLILTTVPVGLRTFALKVTGDLMEPEFIDGDLIVVEPELTAQNGDYVIAQHEQSTTFKQLCRESGEWYLKPINPRYPIKPLGETVIIGVVREKTKRYR